MISCFLFSVACTILSAGMSLVFWQAPYISELYVGVYAALMVIAQIYYLMHRGFRPVGGTLAFVSFVLAVFMLRYSFGLFYQFRDLLLPATLAITVMMAGKLFLG